MRSIERHLAGWILGATALGTLILGLLAYLVILDRLNDAFDQNLKQIARTLAEHLPPAGADPGGASLIGTEEHAAGVIAGDVPVVVTTWSSAGRLLFKSDPRVALPFRGTDGMRRERIAGVDWDVFTVVRPGLVVQVAQQAGAQEQEAVQSAARLLMPLGAMIAVLGALLIYSLRRGLQPLDAAATSVAARSAASLEPIDDRAMPLEIRPLVRSINALMQRLEQAFSSQSRFVADAAHELRTPVTALKLQLQLLERARSEASRDAALGELRAGIDRAQHLIEQLLQLSRAEPGALQQKFEALRLDTLARDCVGRWSVKADQRGVDLGVRASDSVMVCGDREELLVLLNNLIDNALRHSVSDAVIQRTAAGVVVDVVVELVEGSATLRVIDEGPGIAPDERERMFDRFHRGDPASAAPGAEIGSGLGLSIVRAIAERHGASVGLHTAPSGQGLEARVVFPPAPAQTSTSSSSR